MVARALRLGFTGIAITEHDHLWSEREIQALKKETGARDLVILRGKEVITPKGHLVLFNYRGSVSPDESARQILERVRREGGIGILCHPFRHGFLSQATEAEVLAHFSLFDAVEVLTANHRVEENQRGMALFTAHAFTATGSSDSHSLETMGTFATEFEEFIAGEEDLVRYIRNGRCRPVCLNNS
jgi:predicted metal-dependent phosphoesterase TrpH